MITAQNEMLRGKVRRLETFSFSLARQHPAGSWNTYSKQLSVSN